MIAILGHQRWLLCAVTVFAALFCAFVYDTRREPTSERQLRKAGIAATIPELKARYTSEPKQDNGAFQYLQAMKEIKYPRSPIYEMLPFVGDLPYEYGQILTPEQREALHAYVVMNEAAVTLILEAQKCPFSRFPENRYDSIQTEYLSQSRELGRLLTCAALDAALSGDITDMGRMILAGLRLPEVLSEGGLIIDTLVAIALRSIAVSSMEDCLYFITPPKESIRAWLNILGEEQYTTLRTQQDAFRNEATYYNQFFDSVGPFVMSAHRPSQYQLLGIKMANEWTQFYCFAQKQYIQIMKSLIDIADRDFYVAATASSESFIDNTMLQNPRLLLNAILLPSLAGTYSAHVRNLAKSATARTALAALLYKADHGQMPENLEMLTPDYLPVPPRDPFTPDAILRYRLTDTRALFYSVGPNERDDGGKAPGKWTFEDGDIIFRVPIEATGNVS